MEISKLILVLVLSFILFSCGNGTDSTQQQESEEVTSETRMREEEMMHDERRMPGDTMHDNMMPGDTMPVDQHRMQRLREDTVRGHGRRSGGI